MYADDLAPISDSPKDLQRMLIIVYAFSLKWRCKLNPKNSVVFVLEESTTLSEARERLIGDADSCIRYFLPDIHRRSFCM